MWQLPLAKVYDIQSPATVLLHASRMVNSPRTPLVLYLGKFFLQNKSHLFYSTKFNMHHVQLHNSAKSFVLLPKSGRRQAVLCFFKHCFLDQQLYLMLTGLFATWICKLILLLPQWGRCIPLRTHVRAPKWAFSSSLHFLGLLIPAAISCRHNTIN